MPNYTAVAGAVLTASTWNDNVRDQVITRCTSGTRPSSPQEGQCIAETDTDRILMYSGSAWVPIGAFGSTGRIGCSVRRAANQSISDSVATFMSWDTEDFDSSGFLAVTSDTITIPSGLGGLYSIWGYVSVAAGQAWGAGNTDVLALAVSSIGTLTLPLDTGRTDVGYICVPVIPLAAGVTVKVSVTQDNGANSAQNFTGTLHLYMLSA